MSCWTDSNSKGSMEYFAPDRRQEREDTSLVISLKLDLLTNARVVDDAIRFVFEKTKESSNLN